MVKNINDCEVCKENKAITTYVMEVNPLNFLDPKGIKSKIVCLECSLCISSQLFSWDDKQIKNYIKLQSKNIESNDKSN